MVLVRPLTVAVWLAGHACFDCFCYRVVHFCIWQWLRPSPQGHFVAVHAQVRRTYGLCIIAAAHSGLQCTDTHRELLQLRMLQHRVPEPQVSVPVQHACSMHAPVTVSPPCMQLL